MTKDETIIYETIELFQGQECAVPCREISAATGISFKRVQEIIADLVNVHHKRIGSNTRGFFLIVDTKDNDRAIAYLGSRVKKMLQRMAILKRQTIEKTMDELPGMVFTGCKPVTSRGQVW